MSSRNVLQHAHFNTNRPVSAGYCSDDVPTTRGLLDAVGRNYHDGEFYSNEYWRTSSEKQKERERVLEFILNNSNECRVKLLSFPGMSWQFENMLRSETETGIPHLICLEKNISLYHRTKHLIPGKRKKSYSNRWNGFRERTFEYGRATCLYSRVASHQITRRRTGQKKWVSNKLLLMDSSAFMSMLCTDYGATHNQKIDLNNRFYSRTAVWLDFTSNLCAAVEETIRNILFCLESPSRKHNKPVVITILNGRDNLKGEDQRIERIIKLQPAFEYQDHWAFKGKGGTSMLTMCFTAL